MLSSLFLTERPFLVVGRAGMDIYPCPAGTKTEDAKDFFPALGGSSANIAVALSRLGQKVSLVTCVSDDAVGRYALNQLRAYGIDTTYIRSVENGARTSLAVVETRTDDHQSVIYRNNAADFQMDSTDFAEIDFSVYCALLVTGTCLTAEPSRSASLKALSEAKSNGVLTIMDLDYRPYSWESHECAQKVYNQAVSLLDIVVGNDEEFGHMAGSYEQGELLAKSLADSGKIAIYKMGENGSRTYTPFTCINTGIFRTKPIKPTGAGDAFLGSLLAGMCRDRDLAKGLLYGSASAALVVARVGCAPAMPTVSELDEFLEVNGSSVEQNIGVP